MKIVKRAGKEYINMSRSEWLRLGTENGWAPKKELNWEKYNSLWDEVKMKSSTEFGPIVMDEGIIAAMKKWAESNSEKYLDQDKIIDAVKLAEALAKEFELELTDESDIWTVVNYIGDAWDQEKMEERDLELSDIELDEDGEPIEPLESINELDAPAPAPVPTPAELVESDIKKISN